MLDQNSTTSNEFGLNNFRFGPLDEDQNKIPKEIRNLGGHSNHFVTGNQSMCDRAQISSKLSDLELFAMENNAFDC